MPSPIVFNDPRLDSLPEGHPRRLMAAMQKAARENPENARLTALLEVDRDTDAFYAKIIGNRGPEYTRAATEATAYKDAGYTGTVPPTVASWAAAKSWTGQQAADDILLQAAQWGALQAALRAQRLSAKEQIRSAADYEAIQTILGTWRAFLSSVGG